jgi:hypothetical protein
MADAAGSGGKILVEGSAGTNSSRAGAGGTASGGTGGTGGSNGGEVGSVAGEATSSGGNGGEGNANNGGEAGSAGNTNNGGAAGSAGNASNGGVAGSAGNANNGGAAGSGDETSQAGASAGGGGDTGTVTPVSSEIKKSITKQLMPGTAGDPVVIEVGTVSFYPVLLTNPEATVPEGWVLSHVQEAPGGCPYLSGGAQKCLQLFQVHMYPTDAVCQLTADPIHWSWDVACAPGGDCATMPRDLTAPVTFTTTHSSESFCEQTIDFDRFLPQSALVLPVLGLGPVTLRLLTTLDRPYEFSAGSATVPDGFSLVSFGEDHAARACDTEASPNGCRQWWNVVVDTGAACSASGSYSFTWEVSCAEGGDCDPTIETYTRPLNLVHTADLCQD